MEISKILTQIFFVAVIIAVTSFISKKIFQIDLNVYAQAILLGYLIYLLLRYRKSS